MAATDLLGEAGAAHLLRRAGFGPHPGEVAAFAGRTRLQAVQQLLGTKTRRKRPPAGRRSDFDAVRKMQRWWLTQMRSPKWRLHEKLALFWHDHFPSNFRMAPDLRAMATQNALFREHGLGSFRDLAYLVTRDAAMLDYLDGLRNRAENPNENYARELMELFVLGREDLLGVPNYTQEDVVELARALTGFGFVYRGHRRTDAIALHPEDFDAGVKTLFAGKPFEATGNLGVENGDGEPFPAHLNVIDILFTHTDSQGRPTAARFLSKKLWEWFAHPAPPLALVDELADLFVASGYQVRALVQAILTHDAFYTEEAMTSTAKTPVDYALQMIAALDVQTKMDELPGLLDRMGMNLFDPPSVNGWNHSEAWLSTSRYRERFRLAQAVAAGRSKREFKFQPEKLLDPTAATTPELVDGLLARLGVVSVPPATRQALIDYVDGGIALGDEEWLEVKFRGLVVLILTLPEYQVH